MGGKASEEEDNHTPTSADVGLCLHNNVSFLCLGFMSRYRLGPLLCYVSASWGSVACVECHNVTLMMQSLALRS